MELDGHDWTRLDAAAPWMDGQIDRVFLTAQIVKSLSMALGWEQWGGKVSINGKKKTKSHLTASSSYLEFFLQADTHTNTKPTVIEFAELSPLLLLSFIFFPSALFKGKR